MTRKRTIILLVTAWVSLTTARARVFDTEPQYVAQYGANVNKGVPAPPPHKLAIYHKNQLRILVLFQGGVSQGELVSKPKSRLTDADVTGFLATNQGSSSWKKEKVETTKDPKAPQMTMWTRNDGKLFAAYTTSGVPVPFLLIGTTSGGEFLMKHTSTLASYVKE